MKRFLDVTVAISALIILALPLIFIAGLVSASSPGPVFFRQSRVGRFGAPFHILKFRTMRVSSVGPSITRKNDARITPVGAILRRTKLDELPQLFNVVMGDMAIVGPRPEVPFYMDKYTPEQRKVILSVRPGLTDLAAIHFRHEEEILASAGENMEQAYVDEIMPIKFEYYDRYVKNQSLALDVRIIISTLWAIVAPGASLRRTLGK